MNIKIVSDSSSNLLTMEDANYESVPLKIVTAEREFADTPDLNVSEMLEYLRSSKGASSTSCPNVHDWLQAFEGADAVFAIAISSQMSGSCTAAMQAAQDFEGKAYVIDSLTTGPEMELIIEFLRDRIQEGMAFEDICTAVEEYRKHTRMAFSLESLRNLAKNGRVSPAVACLAGVLGIRLVCKASDAGTLEPMHKCRGEKRTYDTLFNVIKEMGYHGGKVRIAHCGNNNGASTLACMIRNLFPNVDIAIRSTTGLCSYYAEMGSVMLGFEV